jgi:hypothetical protein
VQWHYQRQHLHHCHGHKYHHYKNHHCKHHRHISIINKNSSSSSSSSSSMRYFAQSPARFAHEPNSYVKVLQLQKCTVMSRFCNYASVWIYPGFSSSIRRMLVSKVLQFCGCKARDQRACVRAVQAAFDRDHCALTVLSTANAHTATTHTHTATSHAHTATSHAHTATSPARTDPEGSGTQTNNASVPEGCATAVRGRTPQQKVWSPA